MSDKIYFKGAGLITAIGNTIEETLHSIQAETYQPSTVDIQQSLSTVHTPYFTVDKPGIDIGSERIDQIIDSVIQQAIDDAGISEEELQNAGLFVGSTSFDIYRCENILKTTSPEKEDISQHIHSFTYLTTSIQDRFSIRGPVYTYNTACTSSANALIYASEFIRRGDITHAIVLGLEFFNEVTALGFSALELISTNGMRPFDKQRDGLYLGEGCSALIISSEPEENGFAYIAGGNLGDNFSITASNPEGSSVQLVIERALKQASLSRDDISIIKTHGTASLSNDEAEAAGLKKIFGDSIPPIVALKPFIGHTLGACGMNELIIFYKSLQEKSLLTFPSQISGELGLHLATSEDIPETGYYLLNYFGFGGNNTVLVISNA